MTKKMISLLSTLINDGGSEKRIEEIEDDIVDSFDEIAKEGSFYKLPTNEIFFFFFLGTRITSIFLLNEVAVSFIK